MSERAESGEAATTASEAETVSRRCATRRNSIRGYAAIGLASPKNSINVGSVLRAAGAFGAAMVAVTGKRLRGFPTDTECARRRLPLLFVDDLHAVIPHDCVPIAVELANGAKPLPTFPHPPRAFYVFGPEDGTLGADVLSWCRDVVYIPSGCLNLAAAVNLVLYDRMTKREEWKRKTQVQ